MDEHLFIIVYDVANHRRWRQLFKKLKGYGQWVQLSVFQCRLSRRQLVQLRGAVEEIILKGEDHVLFMDLGPADGVKPKVSSLGKGFEPLSGEAVIV